MLISALTLLVVILIAIVWYVSRRPQAGNANRWAAAGCAITRSGMKTLMILAGLSGAGKTHYWENNLKDLPRVDMADIYAIKHTNQWYAALTEALAQIDWLMKTHNEVVLEGYFLNGSKSLDWVRYWCRREQIQIDYKFFTAPSRVRLKRIKAREASEIAVAKNAEDIAAAKHKARKCIELLDYSVKQGTA